MSNKIIYHNMRIPVYITCIFVWLNFFLFIFCTIAYHTLIVMYIYNVMYCIYACTTCTLNFCFVLWRMCLPFSIYVKGNTFLIKWKLNSILYHSRHNNKPHVIFHPSLQDVFSQTLYYTSKSKFLYVTSDSHIMPFICIELHTKFM